MRWGLAVVLAGAGLLAGINAGALMDAITYREAVARAQALLPETWRALASLPPEAGQLALQASQTPTQAQAAHMQGAAFQIVSGGVVLALPLGLDTEYLDLTTGCFRFPRQRISFIVWHIYLSTGCL